MMVSKNKDKPPASIDGIPVELTEEEMKETPDLDLSVEQLDGVGGVTEKKLSAFGVTSIIDICIRGAREISEITGVAKPKADAWVFNAHKILEDNNAFTGPLVLQATIQQSST